MLCISFKRLSFALTAFVTLFVNTNAHANPKVIEGVGLAEPLKVKLEFGEHDYVVVTASQKSADYILSLYSENDETPIKTVNILADKFFDELLLAKKSDCEVCFVTIEGANNIDRDSPYSLKVDYRTSGGNGILQRDIMFLQAISSASESRARSLNSGGDDAKKFRELAISELELVIDDTPQHKWAIHAKSVLMQLLSGTGEVKRTSKLASEIADAKGVGKSRYRVQALYQLGRFTSNIEEKRSLFLRGMNEAKEIGELVDYAKGANYYAISLTRESNFSEALKLFEEVSAIYASANRYFGLLNATGNLSWANQRAGQFPKAIAYGAQQKLLAEEYSFPVYVVWALYYTSIAYSKLGEGYIAEEFLDEAFNRFSAMTIADQERSSNLYGYLLRERAESSVRLGDFDAAESYSERMHNFYLSNKMEARLAASTFLRAEIAFAQNRPDVARKLFRNAIEYDRKNGRDRSAGRNNLMFAELELDQNRILEAVPLNIAALKSLSQTEDYVLLAQNFSLSVELLSSLGAYNEADQLATRVAKFISQRGLIPDQAKFLFRRAIVARGVGQNERALVYLSSARSIVEQALPKVKRRDLRRHYFALQKSVFALNVELLLEEARSNEALKLVESYKARTLNEVIRQVHNDSDVSLNVSKARDAIHDKILISAAKWYRNTESDGESLINTTRELSAELEKIETDLFDERNIVWQPSTGNQSLTLPKVTSSDQLLAYYFLGRAKSWLWLIGEKETTLHQLPARAEIEALVDEAKWHITSHPNLRDNSNAWLQRKAIIDLSAQVIEPIARRLERETIATLIIVPDGPLNGLPFSPLILDDWSTPLIGKVAITYAPSFGSILAIEDRANTRQYSADRKILVVADPISTVDVQETFVRLPNTAMEAKAIQKIAGSNVSLLVADRATKVQFLKKVAEPHSILHFATHGLLNSLEPALSGLMFSKVSENGINYWLLPEISSAKINADLVMLSACESSLGRGVAGEGLLSLSRAFIEGGASQVIGTLWQVQDKATANLTARFYSGLLDDSLVASEALRQAQIAVYSDKNNDWRDPYFWAGFQLQGGLENSKL